MTAATQGSGWELRLGRWQDVLIDVEKVDAMICDPPYLGASVAGSGAWVGADKARIGGPVMGYGFVTATELGDLVAFGKRAGW